MIGGGARTGCCLKQSALGSQTAALNIKGLGFRVAQDIGP